MQRTDMRTQEPPATDRAGERVTGSRMISYVEGRVEAVSPQACRVNGVWHEYPHEWSGWRPAVGQTVRVVARLAWIVERVEPFGDARAEPSGKPASASSSQAGAGAGQRQRLAGVVAASNDRGVKLGETWYNYSRFTPLPASLRARLVPGARVVLEVDGRRWIAGAVIETGGPAVPGLREDGREDLADEEWGLPSKSAADTHGGDRGSAGRDMSAETW